MSAWSRVVICLFAMIALVAGLAGGPVSAAQPAPAQPPAATDEFVPVGDLPPEEQLPAAPLVIGAYAFMWVAVLAYVWSLWRRLSAVQKDLEALTRSQTRR